MSFNNKRAQGSSGMKLIIAAAILIAILFIAYYFIAKGGKTVSTAAGCGEFDCKKTNAECKAAGKADGRNENWVISMTPCTIPNKKGDDANGRCCANNPLS